MKPYAERQPISRSQYYRAWTGVIFGLLIVIGLALSACTGRSVRSTATSSPSPPSAVPVPSDWTTYREQRFTISLPLTWSKEGDGSDPSFASQHILFVAAAPTGLDLLIIRFYKSVDSVRDYADGFRDALNASGDNPVTSLDYFLTASGEAAKMIAGSHVLFLIPGSGGFFHLDFAVDSDAPLFRGIAEHFRS